MLLEVRPAELQHVGEWDSGWHCFRPMCEVWPMYVPKRYRRRQRPSTNGGHCQACEAVARFLR